MSNLKQMMSLAVLIFSTLVTSSAHADAGPGGTGGGLAAENGELFDFYETNIDPLMGAEKINPLNHPAFINRVAPLLRKLHARFPGIAHNLNDNAQKLEWYFTDRPIARSNDECTLLETPTMQVAKQVNGKVVISKTWAQNTSEKNMAGLFVHEMMLANRQGINCTNGIRRAVVGLFNIDSLSDDQLKEALGVQKNTTTMRVLWSRKEIDQEYEKLLKAREDENKIVNQFCTKFDKLENLEREDRLEIKSELGITDPHTLMAITPLDFESFNRLSWMNTGFTGQLHPFPKFVKRSDGAIDSDGRWQLFGYKIYFRAEQCAELKLNRDELLEYKLKKTREWSQDYDLKLPLMISGSSLAESGIDRKAFPESIDRDIAEAHQQSSSAR